MAQLFPRWTNRLPLYLAAGGLATALGTPLLVWYFFSPSFTDVGYRPEQPIPFSHRLHVGELAVDCRYCHLTVEISPVASLPATQVCLGCHQLLDRSVESLKPLFESADLEVPLQWIRVHKTPEYAYFDHSLHLAAGVGCASCHGDLSTMDRVRQVKPLSMSWCLDCHRDPQESLRPHNLLTYPGDLDASQHPQVAALPTKTPPLDCSGCHR